MRTRTEPAASSPWSPHGCSERARRRRKGNEESVPLGIDLDAAVCVERATQDEAMLGKHLGILVGSQLV
jgi:hypothetical protein